MNSSSKKFLIFFLSALFLFSFLSSFYLAFAQDRQLEVQYPNVPGATAPTKTTEALPSYVRYVFNFGIIIFGLIVLAVLVFGGVKYLLSAGKPAQLSEAKNRIIAAFMGLVFLLSSYLIITIINPQLVIFDLPGLTFTGVSRCTSDQDCDGRLGCETPGTCVCDFGTCRAKLEPSETTLIAYEIPIGQLIEKRVWNDDNVSNATILLNEFENFLKKEIPVNQPSNRISDLSKHLVGLTENCSCDATEGVCATPEAGAGGVGCFGNPCKDSREEIQKAVDISAQKIKELKEFKDKINERFQVFLKAGEEFLNFNTEMQECIERGNIMTLAEYLSISQFFSEKGWKTELKKNPSFANFGADDLTFYCIKGGTIFDSPRTPLLNPSETPPGSGIQTGAETILTEQTFCPAIIPIGEMLDNVTIEGFIANEGMESLAVLIDILSEKIQKMLDSVSKCSRKDACNITCATGPNPCFPERPCPGPTPWPCWRCNPLSIPPCLPCVPGMGLSPNLQARGGGSSCQGNPDSPYNGSPCPRDDLNEILEEIKITEDEIFSLLTETKDGLANNPSMLETPEGNLNILEGSRAAAKFCTSSDPENPNIFLVNCLSAIGSTGPDDKVIIGCNPQSLFCCTADKSVANRAQATLPRETRELTYYTNTVPTSEDPFLPSETKNNVPYFSQKDPRWAGRSYERVGTIKSAGCGPTSMAMVLRYYDKNVDPAITTDWSATHGFRAYDKKTGKPAGTSWDFFPAISKAYGLKGCTHLNVANIDNILSKLSDGPIIVSGRGNPPYTKGGHFIVLTGADKHYVYINDPARPKLQRRLISEFKVAGRLRFACQVKK